jgi:hypothetical protein
MYIKYSILLMLFVSSTLLAPTFVQASLWVVGHSQGNLYGMAQGDVLDILRLHCYSRSFLYATSSSH